MFRRVSVLSAAIATSLLMLQLGTDGAARPRPGVDWPQFRGIRAIGVDDKNASPTTLDLP